MKILAPLLLVLLFATSLRAQDTAPWPPDPADIFALGVEVVSIQESYYPRVIADDESRIVKVFDTDIGEWEEFPYPDEAIILSKPIAERSDGTIAFNEPHSYYNVSQPDWPETWLLNPANGEFSRPELVCDWRIPALPGEGQWVFVFRRDTTHLCFTETSEVSSALPDEGSWSDDPFLGGIPEPSPDGNWLALMGYESSEVNIYGTFYIYSYQVNADKFNYLGQFGGDSSQQYQNFSGWVSDTKGMIQQSGPEIYGRDVYTFDVTVPNSLTQVFEGRWSQFFDDPPREEYLETTRFLEFKFGTSVGEHVPCTFSVYDEYGFNKFELGYDCGGIQRSGDDYLYLGFRPDLPPGISTLNNLDRSSGEIEELFNGEIEALDSVSPDGRYAVLLMDRSGEIETQETYPEYFAWGELTDTYIAIVDMQSSLVPTLIYRSENFEDQHYYNGTSWWIDDQTLLLSINCFDGQKCARLIRLNESGYTVHAVEHVDYPLMLSPDEKMLLTAIHDKAGAAVLAVIRVSDGSVIPISKRSISSTEQFEWIGNDLLSIRLSDESNSYEQSRYITYTIRIPQ